MNVTMLMIACVLHAHESNFSPPRWSPRRQCCSPSCSLTPHETARPPRARQASSARNRLHACSGRQKLGRKNCDGERLPKDKLEAAILDQFAGLYRDGSLIRNAIQEAAANRKTDRAQLAESACRSPRRSSAPSARSSATKTPSRTATWGPPATRTYRVATPTVCAHNSSVEPTEVNANRFARVPGGRLALTGHL